jgi:cyclic lactone autoinducer peptide
MMRKLLILGSSLLTTTLVFIAQTNVNSFKWLILYEPEIPESMR